MALLLGYSPALQAVPNSLEPELAEAGIAFQTGKYDLALSIIDRVLERNPQEREFRELKALCLRQLGNDKEAAGIYQGLIKDSTQGGVSEKVTAAYHFELGLIELRLGNLSNAELHLSRAIDLGFNVGAAHYFLGLVLLQKKNPVEATSHFAWVIDKERSILRAAAHTQLGKIELDERNTRRALSHYWQANKLAEARLQDPDETKEAKALATQIISSTQSSLTHLTASRFYGSVSFFTLYDSNVYSQIGGAQEGTSNVRTAKALLQGAIHYATSATKPWQFLAAYGANTNYHSNPNGRGAQFFTQHLSATAKRDPVATFHWGAKTEIEYSFRWKTVSAGNEKFAPYELLGSFTPFSTYYLNSRTPVGGTLTARWIRFYGDVDTDGEFHRSGYDISLRTFIRSEQPDSVWNPEFGLEGGLARTQGIEYRGKSFSLSLSNRFEIATQFTIDTGVTGGVASFNERNGGSRTDKSFTFFTGFSYWLNRSFILSVEIRYSNNESTVADYKYSRLISGGGITFAF